MFSKAIIRWWILALSEQLMISYRRFPINICMGRVVSSCYPFKSVNPTIGCCGEKIIWRTVRKFNVEGTFDYKHAWKWVTQKRKKDFSLWNKGVLCSTSSWWWSNHLGRNFLTRFMVQEPPLFLAAKFAKRCRRLPVSFKAEPTHQTLLLLCSGSTVIEVDLGCYLLDYIKPQPVVSTCYLWTEYKGENNTW